MSIEVRVVPSVRSVPREVWDALDGVEEAPFLSWDFLDAMETTGCVGAEVGWLPHHLTFWDSGVLLGASPGYLKGNSEGEFVFDYAWAGAAERAGIPYYPKLLVASPFTPATGARLLAAKSEDRLKLMPLLAEALRKLVEHAELSSAHVLFPTEAEARALEAAGMAARRGIQFHWVNNGYATFDDFLARFSSKRRNQIKRERRSMGEQGIVIETRRDRVEPEVIDHAFQFYLSTVDKFTWGRRYLNRAFFEEMCARMPGKVEIVLARMGTGGKPIAGALNLAGKTKLFGRYWGAAEDRPFLHFNVCFYHSIEECIAQGRAVFEPGAGGEHKLVRGFEPTITWSAHHIAHPGLDRAIRSYLEREGAAVEEGAAQKGSAFR